MINDNPKQIIKEINKVIRNYEKNIYSTQIENPYYFGNVSSKIEKILKSTEFESARFDKVFVKF